MIIFRKNSIIVEGIKPIGKYCLITYTVDKNVIIKKCSNDLEDAYQMTPTENGFIITKVHYDDEYQNDIELYIKYKCYLNDHNEIVCSLYKKRYEIIEVIKKNVGEKIEYIDAYPNYVKNLEDNLIADLPIEIRKQFENADGNELSGVRPKMHCIGSSSALAVNLFQFIYEDIKEKNEFGFQKIFFEYKLKTLKFSPRKANIDVYLEKSNQITFIECKFLEPYDITLNYTLSEAYYDESRYYLQNKNDIRLFIEAFHHKFNYYDYDQILKMVLAVVIDVSNNYSYYQGKDEITILNLYWDEYRLNDQFYKEKLYASELIDALLSQLSISKSKNIKFKVMTYNEYINSSFTIPKKTREYLKQKYLLKID